jgi:hypothetical protein
MSEIDQLCLDGAAVLCCTKKGGWITHLQQQCNRILSDQYLSVMDKTCYLAALDCVTLRTHHRRRSRLANACTAGYPTLMWFFNADDRRRPRLRVGFLSPAMAHLGAVQDLRCLSLGDLNTATNKSPLTIGRSSC